MAMSVKDGKGPRGRGPRDGRGGGTGRSPSRSGGRKTGGRKGTC